MACLSYPGMDLYSSYRQARQMPAHQMPAAQEDVFDIASEQFSSDAFRMFDFKVRC